MKKLLLLLTVSTVLFSCGKVGENEYIVTGTVTGIANGKTVILEKQNENGMGFVPVDTVKIENGKFEIKGKALEPALHLIQVQDKEGKIPFILENGEIAVIVDKDSIHKSKISGTYNNDEFFKFNTEIAKTQKVSQKKMMEFQTKNMQVMQEAQQKKDTAVIQQLMKQYQELQKEGVAFYVKYAETHPKAFISTLIVDGMFNAPDADIEQIKKIYASFDEVLKNTKPGKAIKTKLDKASKPMAAVTAPAATEAK
jgi:hypothetical protein